MIFPKEGTKQWKEHKIGRSRWKLTTGAVGSSPARLTLTGVWSNTTTMDTFVSTVSCQWRKYKNNKLQLLVLKQIFKNYPQSWCFMPPTLFKSKINKNTLMFDGLHQNMLSNLCLFYFFMFWRLQLNYIDIIQICIHVEKRKSSTFSEKNSPIIIQVGKLSGHGRGQLALSVTAWADCWIRTANLNPLCYSVNPSLMPRDMETSASKKSVDKYDLQHISILTLIFFEWLHSSKLRRQLRQATVCKFYESLQPL